MKWSQQKQVLNMVKWFKRTFKTNESEVDEIEEALMLKVQQSQRTLLDAATSTADAAHAVTSVLKRRLDDGIRQIEVTARLLHDALIVCTPCGTIISFNRAASIIFGWDSNQVIGKTLDLLFASSGGGPVSVDDVLQVLSSQSPIDGSEEFDEHLEQIKGKQKNGNLIWVDGNVSEFERQDGSILMLLLIKDVSKMMAAQQQLCENEARYRSIFEQNFDGIVVVDNHHIVAVNPAITDILGFSEEEMLAQPMTKFISEKYHNLVTIVHDQRIVNDDDPHNYLVQVIKSSGAEVDVLISSTLIIWGSHRCSLLMMKDLTKINS